MARPLQEALAERAQLAQQVSNLNLRLTALDDEIFARVHRLAEAIEGNAVPTPIDVTARQIPIIPITNRVNPYRVSGAKTSTRHEISAAVTEVLRSVKRPMKLQMLLDEITKRGIVVGGQRPSGNLSAHLGLTGLFETGNDGWWFKGQARPNNKNAPEGANLI